MNSQLILLSADQRQAKGFFHGLWHGFKAIVLTVWNAIPFDHPHSAYHWGYLVGMLVFLIIVAFIVTRR